MNSVKSYKMTVAEANDRGVRMNKLLKSNRNAMAIQRNNNSFECTHIRAIADRNGKKKQKQHLNGPRWGITSNICIKPTTTKTTTATFFVFSFFFFFHHRQCISCVDENRKKTI